MGELYMVEILIDTAALLRFAKVQSLQAAARDEDLGYTTHAWMKAAFGDLAPYPWRLLVDGHRPTRVLAYSGHGAEALQEQMRNYASPMVATVTPNRSDIASKVMPDFGAGRQLGFEVICCPVGRRSNPRVEKDVFLMRADHAEPGTLDRTQVYKDWIRTQLEEGDGVLLDEANLEGFRFVHQVRKDQAGSTGRRQNTIVRPQALFRGRLTVQNPDGFRTLLLRGVGRHRAFGYGMLLLRAPR